MLLEVTHLISLAAGKNKCKTPSFKQNLFQAKSSLSIALSFWSLFDSYSLQEEFYPADHVYPLDHIAYWSANNFVCWINDFNDFDGYTNPVHT